MKKKGVYLIVMLFALIFAASVPISAKAATYTWKSVGKNGDMRCYKNGKTLVKNKWVGDRHLNSSGYMDRNKWLTKSVNGKKTRVFVRDDGRWVKKFKAGWQKINGKYYYYTSAGVMLKSRWITIAPIGKYYVNKYGYRLTGLCKMPGGYRYFSKDGVSQYGWKTINKKKYYFQKSNRLAITNQIYKFSNGKSYLFDSKGVMQTGWQKVNNKWYYFKNNMKTGWLELNGKKYYLSKRTGERVTGIYSIDGKLYAFHVKTGVMITGRTVTWKGRKYIAAANGECTLVPDTTNSPSDRMLFFLTFESGSAAYNQTGGDSGNACGAYQFDNRYSLLPFVKYAYSQNAKLCAEFKPYVALTNGTKLKGNKKFYKAWNTIYARNPKQFAELQDKFAKVNYYDPVETTLARSGINLAVRSEVVKGAVYSYSIQHGQTTAVNAVKAIKATPSMTDAVFLQKLYKYRIKKFPAYESRYLAEYALAISKL